MKKIYLLLLCISMSICSFSQTIVISGQCIGGSITATQAGTVDGKPAYAGTGTILGGTSELTIFWIGGTDNVWVIAFDGQPFYTNECDSPIPPGTSPNICQWEFLEPNEPCTGPALSVTGAVVLPVSLTGFTATANGNSVLLRWNTQQESNNRGFAIQHSADGQQWTDIGFVAGAGNSSTPLSYTFTHNTPLNGLNYYRLAQQDFDGQTSLSDIATASISSNRFFTISNNPGNGIYNINMPAGNEVLELQVIDASGKMIISRRTRSGNQLVDLGKHAPGGYWLRIKKGNETATVQLIKL